MKNRLRGEYIYVQKLSKFYIGYNLQIYSSFLEYNHQFSEFNETFFMAMTSKQLQYSLFYAVYQTHTCNIYNICNIYVQMYI